MVTRRGYMLCSCIHNQRHKLELPPKHWPNQVLMAVNAICVVDVFLSSEAGVVEVT